MQTDHFNKGLYLFDNNDLSSVNFDFFNAIDGIQSTEKLHPRIAMANALDIVSIAREQNISLSALKRQGHFKRGSYSQCFLKVFSMAVKIERDLHSVRINRWLKQSVHYS